MKPWLLLLSGLYVSASAEEFSFDLSAYQKPAYEISGFAELSASHAQLNRDSALYNLLIPATESTEEINQYSAAVQLEGLYRFSSSQLSARLYSETQDNDVFGNQHDSTVHELYYADTHIDGLRFELGKRVQKWGKGYAWNPVGFVERKKDPNDPDLSREGYIMATMDYVRSYQGELKTLALIPVILPVTEEINDDYSGIEDTNYAAKLYLLYRDIDIDIMLLANGSKAGRLGFDFSTNVTPSFELHGEWVYISDQILNQLDNSNQPVQLQQDVILSLIGIRYLSNNDITWISEYYHNGAGYSKQQLEQFYLLAKTDPASSPALFDLARQLQETGYGSINPGRDYFYLSAIKKEPFDLVYFNVGINSIFNLHDGSYSLTPEFLYTGLNDTEMRLRLVFLQGEDNTEYGEKLNNHKIEFRFRYYF